MRHAWMAAFVLLVACRPDDPAPAGPDQQIPIVVGSGSTGSGSRGAGGHSPQGLVPTVRIGTWNLHNYSTYGVTEYRTGDIASEIERIDADVLGVQELKVTDGTAGEAPQAWDVLLDELEDYEGLHNPWNSFDTTVGLFYKPSTTTVIASRALFDDDSYAFPRPPLEVEIEIEKDDLSVTTRVIVLHLKAFSDSVDRRRAACDKLDTYLREAPDARVILLGDLNDDPHDPPADNAFAGTFLDAAPHYRFLTQALPPESVTSLGYHHFVDGVQIDGEFLDHFIVTGALADDFSQRAPVIQSVPESERSAFAQSHSDHFPVVLDLSP